MKATITLIASLLLLTTGGGRALRAQTDVPPEGARYGVKSAIIEQRNLRDGNTRIITYIDDYGAKESQEIVYKDGRAILDILEIEKGTMVGIIHSKKTAERFRLWEKPNNYFRMTPEEMKRFQISDVPYVSGSINKRCKRYRLESMVDGIDLTVTYITWEGIVLQKTLESKKEPEANTDTYAISIEVNVPIPPEKFEVPKGIKIKESPDE